VGFLLIPSVCRLLWDVHGTRAQVTEYSAGIVLALALFLYLAGRRMVRFRELSELPVFRTYLACAHQSADSGLSVAASADAVEGE
jgi:hypothetical protein